ncbi:MAG: M20/M25/M40 family metallo-hydrolase [Flavobacteriales bacterium]|nr:M20/M25/M40 family metallo-hydrolase [Flavobacteriales bacterium]
MRIIIIGFFLIAFWAPAQECDYIRLLVDSLSSPHLHGRGYVKDGHLKAARLIANEFESHGISKFDNSYFQNFEFPVNTFPDTVYVRINDKVLSPGYDYILHPKSGSCNASFYDYKFVKPSNFKRLQSKKTERSVFVVDRDKFKKEKHKGLIAEITEKGFNNCPILFLEHSKLTFSYAREQLDYPIIRLLRSSYPEIKAKEFSIDINASFHPKQKTQNVIGYIEGTEFPDSFFVFTGHYDHLGRMGTDTYFPGANDNASGTAMIMSLAKYFKENPPKYSIAFMAFGAEESGILGSKYYVENPLFPLEQIKFLINMDIFGTGEDGIKIVNSTVFTEEYDRLVNINETQNLLKTIAKRGKAANSDHHYFTEKGVRAFFIYTMGGISFYHDIFDRPETLPLSKCSELSKLLISFVNSY